jgi:membrane protein DedA with SNARE-associated domain
MTHIDPFIAQYGYFAIFALLMLGIVGPLIPDETILVVTGVFIHRGQLLLLPAAVAAIAGSLCGITLSWLIGFYGFAWIDRHWPWFHRQTAKHLGTAEKWFARFGKSTLFFGYFVAGVRHVTALFAGISCMPYREFAVTAYAGGVCWVLTFLAVGYFAGEEWSRIAGTVDGAVIAVAAVAIAVTIFLLARHRRPRA